MRRKVHKRLLPALLAAVMLLSLLPPRAARAAGEDGGRTGSISATLRIDYEQTLDALRERNVRAELLRGSQSLGSMNLWESAGGTLGGYPAAVTVRNRDGEALVAGNAPGYLDLVVKGLPAGAGNLYTLRFTGRGYTACEQTVELNEYDKALILGTGDATFTLGDVNSDGRVDEADRTAVSAALGSESAGDLAACDLSGDGKIDITDLAYVNRQLAAQGDAQVLDGAMLAPPVDLDRSLSEMDALGLRREGELADLFMDNGQAVTFRPRAEGDGMVIPVTLSRTVEMEEIRIISPDSGAIQKGSVLVEDGAGNQTQYDFDHTLPAGIHAIGRTEGQSVITINLGRRVAVKKITINVEKTPSGFAVVETIQFLRDIVPENPVAPNSEIKNLTATAGNEQVSLTWGVLPNISGYKVTYWPADGSEAAREIPVDVNQAVVTGLENGVEYQFAVTPVDGTWTGKASAPVSATPKAASAPPAPDMVTVTAGDGVLNVSWKKAENASFYEVYYTDQAGAPTGSYTQSGGQLAATGTTISGLTNGVTYYIYIIAGNDIGRSGPSRISTGTPKAVDYSRPEGIPTEGVLDRSKIESIQLADPRNYNAGAYTSDSPFTPENLIDGDYRTHWTAGGSYWGNEHVDTVFTEPVDLYSAIWSPRLDGSYPNYLQDYSVRVWYEGEDLTGPGHHLTAGIDNGGGSDAEVWTWPEIPNRASIPTCRFAILPFGPVENVKKISVAVEQAVYNTVSCSELMFLEYDPARCLPDNIAALFADDLHTQLVPGVTQEQIDALRERLTGDERSYYLNPTALDDELALAQELLTDSSGAPTGTSVILRGIDSRSNSADGAKYGQSGSDLQPLGAAAGANQEIIVYAGGIPEGQTVTLYASQYNAEASTWRAKIGEISNGRNVLTVPQIGNQNTPRGGSLYLTYSGQGAEGISLHVRKGVPIPVLDLSDWHTMTEEARRAAITSYVDALTAYVPAQKITSANQTTEYRNVTEIATPTVLLSIPASSALSGLGSEDKVQQLYNSVLAWEDLMHICKTTQGIDATYAANDMQSRQNIRCMQMFAGAFMYAAGNHVGIGYGSCSGMVGGQPIPEGGINSGGANSLFGWGIAHEIGHNMDKLGKAEITNNIYSIMVQTYDGENNTLKSRLEKSNKYAGIFTKVAQGYPGASNNVFVQLGMYWQLHLAYDGGKNDERGPMWFYNQFFKAWKAGTYFNGASSYDDKVALTAAGVAGKDLTEFFTRWGMTLSESTKAKLAEYGKEDRAIWYLSDQSRRNRLDGVQNNNTLSGDATATLPKGGKEITITYPALAGSVQGYEIRRNGKSIAFTTGTTYTDVIGTANNRTYAYEVVAYDTLGNARGSLKTNEVLVQYDMVIDSSQYAIARGEGDAVTITFTQETPVTGFKISGGVPEGAFTVQIGGKTVRTGTFAGANQTSAGPEKTFVTYFNQPESDGTDASIHTYDTTAVTITGIPADMALDRIQPISYAGDRVSFLEEGQGAVGILGKDYRYGEGMDEVIQEGTLVILGQYQGDPVYNTVDIEGVFTKTVTTGGGEIEEAQEETRSISGEAYLFAEVPENGQLSDISNGLFIFVPNLEHEKELQGEVLSNCAGTNLLPSRIRVNLYRTDDPEDASRKRLTAQTLWINSPGGTDEDLPRVVLTSEGGVQQ